MFLKEEEVLYWMEYLLGELNRVVQHQVHEGVKTTESTFHLKVLIIKGPDDEKSQVGTASATKHSPRVRH